MDIFVCCGVLTSFKRENKFKNYTKEAAKKMHSSIKTCKKSGYCSNEMGYINANSFISIYFALFFKDILHSTKNCLLLCLLCRLSEIVSKSFYEIFFGYNF